MRSLIFVALISVQIWLTLEKKLTKQMVWIYGIGILLCTDVIGNASRHLTPEKYIAKRRALNIFTPTTADAQILADPDIHYRVLNNTRSPFNDAITSYHHKSIGGYHGAKLRRYQELYEFQISRNNQAVLDMLNTKYVIVSGQNGPKQRQRTSALGPVWFVDNLQIVENGDEEMAGLNAPFDGKSYAVIQEKYAEGLLTKYNGSLTDQISLKTYSPDKMVYTSDTDSKRFAVFSEIYYILKNGSGWHAFIDGEEVDIRKVNFTLRGLEIPSGGHEIIFEFNKDKILALNKIRRIFSILTGFIIIGLLGWFIRNERQTVPAAAS